MKRITVYCGSKHGNNPFYQKAAEDLGKELAHRKIELVYGGGAVGLMGVIANAVLTNHGSVIGVIPEKLYEMEVAHMGLTELYRVKTMHERKALMADLSDAFIALPGGIGTLEEIMEVITWAQIGYHKKPCAFLNIDGYYENLFKFFETMEQEGFLYDPMLQQCMMEDEVSHILERFGV